MKRLFLAALFAVTLSSVSYAASVEFPSDAPVATIDFPDGWKPTETESGIEAMPEDQSIYFSIDVAEKGTTDKIIDDVFAFLEKNGVKVDGSTQKKTDDKLNGLDISYFSWSGTDNDGAVNVAVALVSPKPGKLLVITYWGTQGTQEAHLPELETIMASLKPAGE